MVYFKTVMIEATDGQKVEAAIRKYAAKRHSSLDLLSSSTDIGTDKFFLGIENENNIRITRLRSSLEHLLPKLILKFEKANGFTQYKIRYSILSNFVFAFFSISIILNIIYSRMYGQLESNITPIFIFLLFFLLLSSVELRLTKSKLKSAVEETYSSTNI